MYGIIASSRVRGGSTPVPTYDTDFQAWIDEVLAKGYYLTSISKLDLVNDYIVDLKAQGVWQEMDKFSFRPWNDLLMENACKIDLKTRVEDLVYGGVTYTEKGFEGNGVDGYINTNFNGAVMGINYSPSTGKAGRIALVYKEASSSTKEILCSDGSSNDNNMRSQNSSYLRFDSGGNRLNNNYDQTGTGFMANFRDSSTDLRLYNKGVETLESLESIYPTNSNYVEFSRGLSSYSNIGNSILIFSSNLSNTKYNYLRTRTNTLLTSIGLTPYA